MFKETKDAILGKIEDSKKLVIDMIKRCETVDGWDEIKEEIDFIGQAYGALAMIEYAEKIPDNVENKLGSPQPEGTDQV